MTTAEARRRTAEIASHLAEIRALARSIGAEHPQGEALYRALQNGCLPAEHADPVGLVEDVVRARTCTRTTRRTPDTFVELPKTATTLAAALSLHEEVVLATASVSAVYELNATELHRVWQRAARAGARYVTLHVRAEGSGPEEYTGQVQVIVLEHETWPDLDDTSPPRRLMQETRDSGASPESRLVALARIAARRSELLKELTDLTEVTAGHEEALASSPTGR